MSRINLYIRNTEKGEGDGPTWYGRNKSYEWDMMMDNDIKNCTIGHTIESIELNNFHLNNKKSVRDLIELLEKAEMSMSY